MNKFLHIIALLAVLLYIELPVLMGDILTPQQYLVVDMIMGAAFVALIEYRERALHHRRTAAKK